jgi:hypothetical protein
MKALVLALLAVALALPVVAQEEDGAVLEGYVDVLYRAINVNGSERKFNEDFDGLGDGARIGELSLNWSKLDLGMVDYFRIDLEGLGGDPYQRTSFRLGQQGGFELSYNQFQRDYMYDLFHLIGDEDGHQWDTETRRTEIDLSMPMGDWFELVLSFDETDRQGPHIFMKDLSREVFLLEAPIDRRARRYTIGGNFDFGASRLTLRQSYRRYFNDFDQETEGDLGVEPEGPTQFDFYDYRQREQSDAYLTEAQFVAPFGDRFLLSVGYYGTLFGEEELDSRVDVDAVGLDFTGAPLEIVGGFSESDIEQDTQLLDVNLAIGIADPLTLHLQYRDLQQEMEAQLVQDLTGDGTVDQLSPTSDYELSTATALLEWRPSGSFGLRAGYRIVDRELERAGWLSDARDENFESDGDNTWLAGLTWRPADWVRLSAEYEDADIDTAFTEVLPLERSRTRARVVFMPQDQMQIGVTFLDFEANNEAGTFFAETEGTTWTASFWHRASERVDYLFRYSTQELDRFADVQYDGAGFGAVLDGISIYDSEMDFWHGRLNYQAAANWRTFVRFTVADAEAFDESFVDDPEATGFPSIKDLTQDWSRYDAGAYYDFDSGLFVGLVGGYFDLDQANDLLDYDGMLWELHGGMRF